MNDLTISKNKGEFLLQIIKGVLVATSVSLVCILLFTLVVKYIDVPENFISPVNQVLRILSIYLGVRASMGKNNQKGLVKGLLVGALYTILAFAIFSAINPNFSFNLSILNDVIFGSIIGGICGIMILMLNK